MREFVTAVEVANATEEDVQKGDTFDMVKQDAATGEVLHTHTVRYYRPSDGQLAVLMAGTGRTAKTSDKVGTVLNFFQSTIDQASQDYIYDRLMDHEDPFGLEEIQEIMEEMIAEWGGRPTKRSSASTQSQRTDGQNSTPTTPASTSSPSLLIGS